MASDAQTDVQLLPQRTLGAELSLELFTMLSNIQRTSTMVRDS